MDGMGVIVAVGVAVGVGEGVAARVAVGVTVTVSVDVDAKVLVAVGDGDGVGVASRGKTGKGRTIGPACHVFVVIKSTITTNSTASAETAPATNITHALGAGANPGTWVVIFLLIGQLNRWPRKNM